MAAASKARPVRRPPPRGRPYYDVERGRTMIVPPGGGKAVEYVGPGEGRRGFEAGKALRRAGVRTARAADRAAARAPAATGRALRRADALPNLGGSPLGLGGLLIYGFATVLGLALLDNALSGRGPAAVETILGTLGSGLKRLVDADDPVIGKGSPSSTPSSPVTSSTPGRPTPPGATTHGVYPLGRLGKVIGVPGAGTHSRSEGPNNWQSDNAADVKVPIGTPVYAARGGRVVKAGYLEGQGPGDSGRFAGQRVTIESGDNGFYYAHLSAVTVKPGQQVQTGQLIGYSGSANGVPHLHFAVMVGNPLDWLRTQLRGGR